MKANVSDCLIIQSLTALVSYHKNTSWCCASVAAADRLTCRLVLERLPPSEDRIVVEGIHQGSIHIAKENTNLRFFLKKKDNKTVTGSNKNMRIMALHDSQI